MRTHTATILAALVLLAGCPETNDTPTTEAGSGDARSDADGQDRAGDADAPSARAARAAVQQKAGSPVTDDIPAPADVAAPPADATVTASGLAYKVLQPGTGKDHPGAEDTVEVHYTGWMTDGTMFDSSRKRGETATFPLNHVISGWTEGVQLMVEGETTRFWIPADLAYGDTPRRPGGPYGTLVFDIELISIDRPIPAPADVAAPPADAVRTSSGLAYKVLQAGTGTQAPAPTDTVTVHYTGWTTDGKMFDSSVKRGEPASFPLNRVIAGWTEGVQLMVVGEKTRFWIPADLAYGDPPKRPGAPAGMLVFDIELLEIKP